MVTVLSDTLAMKKHSKKSTAQRAQRSRTGEHNYRSNKRALLPRPHESVRLESSDVYRNPGSVLFSRETHIPTRPARQLDKLLRARLLSPVNQNLNQALKNPFAPLRVVSIQKPAKVKFCVNRSIRKEVLFAKNIAGKKGSSPGPYKRTQNSQYSCKK